VSNVDATALAEAVKDMDPKATLVAVASKTFTTTETLMNAESALEWLRDGGVEDPYGQVIALTAAPEKAIEWGVDQSRILPFAESVGGRYSLWCSIGFPVAAALGWAAFEELLEGAAEMDRHFRTAPLAEMRRFWPPLPISFMRRFENARHVPFLLMTSACACCRIICSSLRWNPTASQ
jgi:glucose-6-phosphate isomerase